MTEKEQKILNYVEKRKKFILESVETLKVEMEDNEFIKILTKDIEEYNTVLSSDIDFKDDNLVKDLQKIQKTLLALRRICVHAGIANNSEVPQIKLLEDEQRNNKNS